MPLLRSLRLVGWTLVLGAVVLGATIVGAAAATPRSAVAAVTPPRTVTGLRISRRPGTLAPGTRVGSADLGQRVFTDAKHGFALASVGQAQYPAATNDGGTTWRTDGPALHVNAAQAPLAIVSVGAANRKTVFAYGGGQVIDATSDGGRQWCGALFDGLVMAVVPGSAGHLVAFVDASTSGAGGVTWQYVSKDGGRDWRYDTTVGGS
jgi:hypothetical protein